MCVRLINVVFQAENIISLNVDLNNIFKTKNVDEYLR